MQYKNNMFFKSICIDLQMKSRLMWHVSNRFIFSIESIKYAMTDFVVVDSGFCQCVCSPFTREIKFWDIIKFRVLRNL